MSRRLFAAWIWSSWERSEWTGEPASPVPRLCCSTTEKGSCSESRHSATSGRYEDPHRGKGSKAGEGHGSEPVQVSTGPTWAVWWVEECVIGLGSRGNGGSKSRQLSGEFCSEGKQSNGDGGHLGK